MTLKLSADNKYENMQDDDIISLIQAGDNNALEFTFIAISL